MTPESIIVTAREMGYDLTVQNLHISVKPKNIPKGLLLLIKKNKAEIIKILGETVEEPTLEEVIIEARWICEKLPKGDKDRLEIIDRVESAKFDPKDDILKLNLMIAVSNVYHERIEERHLAQPAEMEPRL